RAFDGNDPIAVVDKETGMKRETANRFLGFVPGGEPGQRIAGSLLSRCTRRWSTRLAWARCGTGCWPGRLPYSFRRICLMFGMTQVQREGQRPERKGRSVPVRDCAGRPIRPRGGTGRGGFPLRCWGEIRIR